MQPAEEAADCAASAVAAVPWRFNSKGSLYAWHPRHKQWAIERNLMRAAQAALHCDAMPTVVFQDEAHAQRICRRCAASRLSVSKSDECSCCAS